MKTVVLVPTADVQIEQVVPVPNDGRGIFAKIDEGMPLHDGDSTRFDSVPMQTVIVICELTPLPHDFMSSTMVRFRAAAKSNLSTGNLFVALVINNLLYSDINQLAGWDFTLEAAGVYLEAYASAPALPVILPTDHLELVIAGYSDTSVLSLTAVQVEIDYTNRPPTSYHNVDNPTTTFNPVIDPDAIVTD